MKKIGIVSCYFQHNYGSMLQALATQMALDKLNYENETVDISGFNHEIKKAKLLYFAKASLTSDILLSKLGMAKNVLIKSSQKMNMQQCRGFAMKSLMNSAKNGLECPHNTHQRKNLEIAVKKVIPAFWLGATSFGFREILQRTITH